MKEGVPDPNLTYPYPCLPPLKGEGVSIGSACDARLRDVINKVFDSASRFGGGSRGVHQVILDFRLPIFE